MSGIESSTGKAVGARYGTGPSATRTAGTTAYHATPALAEADRLMTVCNSCRYCEGLCAVFPAMEMRRAFTDGDLNYLANLCHNCGACYYDCQFSPPHEFNVNVPQVLAQVRNDSYAQYAWPRALAPLFERNGVWLAVGLALAIAGFVGGFMVVADPAAVFASGTEPGAFYRLMPHNGMALLFGAAFCFMLFATAMGAAAFWRDSTRSTPYASGALSVARGGHDAATLTNLHGGGDGCMTGAGTPGDHRRTYHHLTAYGFLLCLASTSTATLYHYVLAREAPYPWWDLPVVLGTIGGVGLVIGTCGLLQAKLWQNPDLQDGSRLGMDAAFTLMLLLTAATGLLLLVLRATPAMGLLLALHLGVVLALFVTMPYSKFVHGLYRGLALVRSAGERRSASEKGRAATAQPASTKAA
jgi:citrate/tricarballylate utilization protein